MPTNARNMAAARGAPRSPVKATTGAKPIKIRANEPANARPAANTMASLIAGPAGEVPTGVQIPNVNVGAVRQMPMHLTAQMRSTGLLNDFGPVVGPRPPQVVTALSGLLDSVLGAAKSVIPPHTVVGKLLGGDAAGATRDAAKIVAKGAQQAAVQQGPITPYQPEPVYASLAPQNNTQKLLLAGAGVLGLALVFSIARRRGAF
jgi:hypothetical protein